MATEREIDRMVVRLVGNQEDYQKMLKEVEKNTNETSNWAAKQAAKVSNAFNRAFESAKGMIASTGRTIRRLGLEASGIGAAAAAPLSRAALDFSDYGKQIREIIQQSRHAADDAKMLRDRTLSVTEAYRELARTLALTSEQAQVFRLISERTGIAIEDLVKRVGTASDEYAAWKKEAESLGLILSSEDIRRAEELAESWVKVKDTIHGLWITLGTAVSGVFKELNDRIVGIIRWVTDWINRNRELVRSIAQVTTKLVIVGTILTGIGTALTMIGSIIGPLIALITAGVAAWLAWDTATGKFLRGEGAKAWEEYGDTAKNAYDRIVSYGKGIVTHVESVVAGVINAIKAGDLESAVSIAWAGAKVAWIRSLRELDEITGKAFSAILNKLAGGDFVGAAQAAIDQILAMWLRLRLRIAPTFDYLRNKAEDVWYTFQDAFDSISVKVQNVFERIKAWGSDAADYVENRWQGVKGFFVGFAKHIGASFDLPELPEFGSDKPSRTEHAKAEIERRNAELEARLEERRKARAVQRGERAARLTAEVLDLTNKLREVEDRLNEAAKAGADEAERKLSTERDLLKTKLDEARAAKEAAEAEAASAAKTKERVEAEIESERRRLELESRRRAIIERYDPVARYISQLKELNSLFKGAERDTRVYREALRDIKREMVESKMIFDMDIGPIASEAARRGTAQQIQLIQNSLELSARMRAERLAEAEAERREKELGAKPGEVAEAEKRVPSVVSPTKEPETKSVDLLGSIDETLKSILSITASKPDAIPAGLGGP